MKCTSCEQESTEHDDGWMKDAKGRDWHVHCAQRRLADTSHETFRQITYKPPSVRTEKKT